MVFFYRYKKIVKKKAYLKALRLQLFIASWSKWYLFVKFNYRHIHLTPILRSWSYRSLYTNKLHYNNRMSIKKGVFLHLFWILDVWKLVQPLYLKGISTTFPIRFECNIFQHLEVYSALQKWVYLYGSNKDKVVSYKVTKNWLKYKPNLWISRSYHYFATWNLKGKALKAYCRKDAKLWYLNRWYIENSIYHKLQVRLLCNVPSVFPTSFTKTLWLRLMRYPCLYNYQWFDILEQLSLYTNRTLLPWSLLYTSKQAWLFDNKIRGLGLVLKSLVNQRTQITEYILVKRWKDLLKNQDLLSRSFQIFIRNSVFFRKYLKYKV